MATPTLSKPAQLLPLTGDVLAHCDGCTWWVRVDELEGDRCTWCRGVVLHG